MLILVTNTGADITIKGRNGVKTLIGTLTDKEIEDLKQQWRMEYMTLLMRDRENQQKGREQGRMEEIFQSVQDGDYGMERGAQKLGISVEQFEKKMVEAGYKIPECV